MYGGGLFLEHMNEPHEKTHNRYYVLFDRDIDKLETSVLPKLCRLGPIMTEGLKSPYDELFSPVIRLGGPNHNHVISVLMSNEPEDFFRWLTDPCPGRLESRFSYHNQKFYMNPAMADLVTGKSKDIHFWFSVTVREHLAAHLKIKKPNSLKKQTIKKAPPEFQWESVTMPIYAPNVDQ